VAVYLINKSHQKTYLETRKSKQHRIRY